MTCSGVNAYREDSKELRLISLNFELLVFHLWNLIKRKWFNNYLPRTGVKRSSSLWGLAADAKVNSYYTPLNLYLKSVSGRPGLALSAFHKNIETTVAFSTLYLHSPPCCCDSTNCKRLRKSCLSADNLLESTHQYLSSLPPQSCYLLFNDPDPVRTS